jgi:hypothetical protein
MIMNFWVPIRARDFLKSLSYRNFSRRSLERNFSGDERLWEARRLNAMKEE